MPLRRSPKFTLTNSDMSELFDLHSEELFRYLMSRVNDQQAAIDIVGEAFAQALNQRKKFRGESIEDARGWIFGIAKNLVLGYYKSGVVERKTMEKLEFNRVIMDQEEVIDEPELSENDLRKLIDSTLDAIKPEYREAITLRYLDGCEYPEIASKLNVTEDVIRARVSRGMKQIRAIVAASDDWNKARNTWMNAN